MSKYTTELRFLCESLTGHEESEDYASIDQIIEDALPIIFSFDFPIFDENYREVLETKILRHYYTREIGCETYGLWKLRLQTKLNEIMPFYNKLYETELFKFNPLYDVDMTTTHTGQKTGERTDVISSTNERENTLENKIIDNGAEIDNRTKNETYNRDNRITDTGVESGSQDKSNTFVTDNKSVGNDIETSNGSKNTTGNKDNTTNNTQINTENTLKSNESSREHDKSNTDVQEDNRTNTFDGERNTNNEETNINASLTQGGNTTTDNDLYSDTPQGALTGVDNMTYLTNARKKTGVVSSSSSTDTNNITSGNTKIEDDNTETSQGSSTKIGKENLSESGSSSENTNAESTNLGHIEEQINETNNETNTSQITKLNTKEEKANETNTETGKHETTNISNREENGNETNYATSNSVLNRNNERTETGNGSSTDSSHSTNIGKTNNTEDYVMHVFGKTAGASYAKMLREFRDNLLNIDMDIIRDLGELFMLIW